MTNTAAPRTTAAVQADIAAIAQVLGRLPVGEAIDPTVQAYVESLAVELAAAKATEDAALIAALHRGIALGTFIEVTDEYLARMAAECAGLED